MIADIYPVVAIGILSLGITFVLFKWLKSYAEGQGEHLGGTIKYGGALAGFVVVTSVLLFVYRMVDSRATDVNIDDAWSMDVVHENGSHVFGKARIRQKPGARDFSMSGELTITKPPGYLSFSSKAGAISGQDLIFVYLNSEGEEGLARGTLLTDAPASFSVNYFDSVDADKNDVPRGLIIFTRLDE